jgi:putative SOS response-associated peptidase YedK
MDFAFLDPRSPDEQLIRNEIDAYNQALTTDSEQELFKQAKRLADAERKLAVKETKAALNDQRIAGNKIKQLKRWIADAKRVEHDPVRDDRIFPDWYAPVLVVENGKRIVRPMRYHCRPAGMDPSIDRTKTGQISGSYNARRDNLTRFWRNQFGYSHGLMLANTFYENVDDGEGGSMELQFKPRTGETMYIACLWSHWADPAGALSDLYSFAAITDEPEPEVAAAGHDRTIINIKQEHVDAWLNPGLQDRDAMQAIFDDKRRPYYEHRKAA